MPPGAHHGASRRWFEAHVARGEVLVSPILLLAEVAGAIARRTDDAELAKRAVEQVLRVPGLRLVPSYPQLGRMAAQLTADLRLRGADAAYVALVTWDRQQRERASTLVAVHTPDTR